MMRVSNLKGRKVKVLRVNPFNIERETPRMIDARTRAEATMRGGAALIDAATRHHQRFETDARWYVARCRAGQEVRIAEELQAADIESWCPMKMVCKPPRRGMAAVRYEVPFFHSYLFVRLMPNAEAWVGALMASQLTAFIGMDGVPAYVSDHVIKVLMLNAKRVPKDEDDIPVKVGQRVDVIEGVFSGFMATVRALMPKHWRVKVDVELFGRITPVELEIDQIAK